jgi:hypothetical protein
MTSLIFTTLRLVSSELIVTRLGDQGFCDITIWRTIAL